MKKNIFLGILILLITFLLCLKLISRFNNDSSIRLKPNSEKSKLILNNDWKLLWEDEFDGKEINHNYWTLQTGGDGWGNNELQYYTDRTQNCYVENGKLILKALKEDYQGSHYTSAKITTKGKLDFLYGKIDIRAKLPTGKGLLPAFWMMPSEATFSDRRKNGEIDIMEMLGSNPHTIYGVTHYSTQDKYKSSGQWYNKSYDFSKDFHTYSLEWSPNELKWLIDNTQYYSLDLEKTFNNDYNPFIKKFYLIINIAIGGIWPGNPTDDNIFPARMEIEYIKYYKK